MLHSPFIPAVFINSFIYVFISIYSFIYIFLHSSPFRPACVSVALHPSA